jgi:ubiquinone/menaquinone biosynthesis C-methylase UbiE
MDKTDKTYLPAAGGDWLLPFYDIFTRLLGLTKVHNRLIRQAAVGPGQSVLEIGCGTGNLTLLAKRRNPEALFVGIDPDPKALDRARRKAARSGSSLKFDRGFSQELPYEDMSFDRVLSAFMFHHVQPEAKLPTIQEALRVLKPGGSLHLVDFQDTGHGSQGHGGGLHGFLAGMVHGRRGSSPQSLVLGLMGQAGFQEAGEVARQSTIMGRIVFYRAVRPQSPQPAAA